MSTLLDSSATPESRPPAPASRGYSPLGQLVLARVREFYREPEAVFWVYGFPIFMVMLLGIAFRNQPVEQIRVDVVDGRLAEQTRAALVDSKSAAQVKSDQPGPRQEFLPEIHSAADCRLRLRTGKTSLVVEAQPESGAAPKSSAPHYEYVYDPTRPESVLARNAVDDRLQRAAGRRDPAQASDTTIDEPGSRYVDFLVPGLLGMSLMGGGLWGVGYVTVDMRIRKLLKRFLATPMKKSHFLAGIMISRLLFMIPEVLVLLVFARLAFGVVIYGSLLAVIILILLGAVMFSGIGLLVASRARTLETVSGLMNLVMLPMWILSGIFFSSERFPAVIQPLVQALPLTHLIDALRGVMLEGKTLTDLALQVTILAAWAIITFALALRWFRWT